MTGATDLEHLNYAFQLKAVIFTHDRHFLEIENEFSKEGKSLHGMIFVSINKLSVGECIKRLALYAEVLSAEDLKNQIEFLQRLPCYCLTQSVKGLDFGREWMKIEKTEIWITCMSR